MTSAETLLFRVNGMPQGKARPRFTRQGRAYTPEKTRDYEAAMIVTLPELGYTPANLKALREQANLTQRQVADITNTVNYATVVRWETDVGGKNHAENIKISVNI